MTQTLRPDNQLTLIQKTHPLTFSNFLDSQNRQLVGHLTKISSIRAVPITMVWGASGFGKSHVLLASARHHSDEGLGVLYLSLGNPAATPEMIQNPQNQNIICVDNIDLVARNAEWELALFNLFNEAKEHGTALVFSSSVSPSEIDFQLPDLLSRLTWGLAFQLQELSAKEKIGALQLHARHRKFELAESVAAMLLDRYSRNMSDLMGLLVQIDKTSITSKKKITASFVRGLIDELGPVGLSSQSVAK